MKRAIELRIFMSVDVPDNFDEDAARFYIEENHCLTNHIDALKFAIDKDDGRHVCNLCPFAAAHLLPVAFPLDEVFDPSRPPPPKEAPE